MARLSLRPALLFPQMNNTVQQSKLVLHQIWTSSNKLYSNDNLTAPHNMQALQFIASYNIG